MNARVLSLLIQRIFDPLENGTHLEHETNDSEVDFVVVVVVIVFVCGTATSAAAVNGAGQSACRPPANILHEEPVERGGGEAAKIEEGGEFALESIVEIPRRSLDAV